MSKLRNEPIVYNIKADIANRLTFTSTSIQGKKMIIQATNTGADLAQGQFDLAIPGGGVGIYNGCTAEWGAPPSGWGAQYGGISSNTCSSFPQALQPGCDFRFGDFFEGADNPTVEYKEVTCPTVLTDKTGCIRSGQTPTGPGSSSSAAPASSSSAVAPKSSSVAASSSYAAPSSSAAASSSYAAPSSSSSAASPVQSSSSLASASYSSAAPYSSASSSPAGPVGTSSAAAPGPSGYTPGGQCVVEYVYEEA